MDNTVETETIHFLTVFNSMKLEIESNDSYQNAFVIDNIIQFLDEYKNTSILIPKLKINIKERRWNYIIMGVLTFIIMVFTGFNIWMSFHLSQN